MSDNGGFDDLFILVTVTQGDQCTISELLSHNLTDLSILGGYQALLRLFYT